MSRTVNPPPEAATLEQIEQRLALLPSEKAAAIRARLAPALLRPPPARDNVPLPSPLYTSWEEYLAKTTRSERRRWCTTKAKKANRTRLMSGTPQHRLSTDDVWTVLESAQGRCAHCSSLALQERPSRPDGAPLPWEHVGRRIGSLGHVVALVNGGTNTPDNLVWSCLWCNTWVIERTPGSTDRGAIG